MAKGWLDNFGKDDNYNDYQTHAPEGMEGDGFSNVGRNSSPAWGGQFQNGGKAPKYVESKNDPRYKAYQDSLALHNYSKEQLQRLNRLPNSNPSKGEATISDWVPGIGWAKHKYNIEPVAGVNYKMPYADYDREVNSKAPSPDYAATWNKTIANTSEKKDGYYGTFPYFKKPQQQVIVKDNNAPQYKTIHTGEGEGRFEPIQRPTVHSIQNNLSPAGLVEPDFELEADVDIHNRARIPQYYDVTDKVNQNFGGSETQYKYYPENGDLPDVAPSPYNTRTVTPHYQMGGSVYPVNYVPEAQTGGSFPGATGFSYARTGDIPSEGPYAKKTMASAQNGKEMQYYQQGLDWQPKTISKNGAWLDKAQTGAKKFKLKDERELANKTAESTNVKKKNFDLEQSKSNKSYINQLAEQQKENKRRKTLTQDQREREDYNARNEQTGSIQTPVEESKWDRTKAIVSNPLTAFGYAARNESLPTRFQHGERNTLDNAIDWINPLQGVAAVSEIPGELGRGEYLNAGLSALDALDLGVYAKGAMKASKPLLQKGAQQLGNVRMSIAPELRQGLQTAGPSFNNKLLPKELEPYISRIGEPSISREEEVFRNVMGRDYRNAKEIKNTIHLDSNGNIISAPTEAIYDPSKKIGPMYPLKQGGIIKDDRGYWNPDNWGKVVEIGSTDITMEGVDQPLLGISDTGDTKLMKPGKNYKFKGKKVTEYPMAQNGLRQEQKGLQNLDNLLNFSNYNSPKKGGWLEKYNI